MALILLPLIWKCFRQFHLTLLAGMLLSMCIEIMQLFSYRVTAVDDLIMNTFGTVIGYLIIVGLTKKKWKKNETVVGASVKGTIIELSIVVGLLLVSAVVVKYSIGSLIYDLPMFD